MHCSVQWPALLPSVGFVGLVKTFGIKSETCEAAIAGLFAIAKAGCPGVGGRVTHSAAGP